MVPEAIRCLFGFNVLVFEKRWFDNENANAGIPRGHAPVPAQHFSQVVLEENYPGASTICFEACAITAGRTGFVMTKDVPSISIIALQLR